MLTAALTLILCPLTLWLVYWYYRLRYFEGYLKTVPGPLQLPLLGSALALGSISTIFPKFMEYLDKYKSGFKVYIGSQAYIFLTEPKDMEFVLGSSTILTKSDFYTYFYNWLGTGLLTSARRKWRKRRKIITPAFHFQILEQFIDVFNIQSEVLGSKLEKELGRNSVDLYPYIARCTLDIICETAMGTSVNAQDDYDSKYVKCVKMLLEIITERSFSAVLGNELLYLFTPTYRKERHALSIVHGYTKSMIATRKKEFLSNIKSGEESVDALGRKKRRAFLDLLLEYSMRDPEFTDEDVCEEVDTFMFEGHDTTATSITFALHALSRHSEIQEKAYQEIKAIFSDNPKRIATHKDLQEMKYLEMVIKESLRLYTTVPIFGREIEEEVQWNGITLPKGLMLMAFPFGLHRSPNLYKNPEKFDPERFSPDNAKDRHSFAFVPFSAGPRNCIGQKFAMLEMKSTISYVLRQFELLPSIPDEELILRAGAVLKSENGVCIRLRKR